MEEREWRALEAMGMIVAKLRSGQITLDQLETFARTGEIAEGVIMPLLGEVKTFPCPRCSKEAGVHTERPFIFKAVHRHDCESYRFECTGCTVHSIPVWDSRCGKAPAK